MPKSKRIETIERLLREVKAQYLYYATESSIEHFSAITGTTDLYINKMYRNIKIEALRQKKQDLSLYLEKELILSKR